MTASSTVLALVLGLCSAGSFLSAHAANTTANPDHAENDADFVCPEYLSIENRLYYTQMVFGSLSIFACSAVITVFYGYNYTRRSLRDRILMGMFTTNIMFSIGNVIPLDLVTTGNTPATCGLAVASLTTRMVGLGIFFGGKYGMVLYEVFIVGASLVSLKTGITETSRRVEMASHSLCVVVGLGVFVGWTAYSVPLMNEAVADFNAWNVTKWDNQQGTELINDLISTQMLMFRVWVGLLGVVIVLWGWSRMVLRQLELEWDEALVSANAQWDRDLWKTEDPHVNGQRIQKRRLLDLRREGYRDVAKPLESYIAVFVLFSAPAIVMATDYCAASTDDQTIPYRCDIVAQMVLSMRSLATAFVYFCDRDRRDDLCDFRVLCRKVWRRLKADARFCAGTATGGRDVARGTRDGYRLHFNKDLDVQEFGAADSFAGSSMRSDSSGPLHATNGHEDADGGVSYQLIEDDNWAA